MDNIPLLIDTEPETSMEQDAEQKIQSKFNSTSHNANKSLFNITLENLEEQIHENEELKNYECRLHQEMKNWKSVFCTAYKDLKQSKQKHPIVDNSILSTEKLDYLKDAVCLQNFIRESLEFRKQAAIFFDYDYAEFVELHEALEDLCEKNLNLIKQNKIRENLANVPKKAGG